MRPGPGRASGCWPGRCGATARSTTTSTATGRGNSRSIATTRCGSSWRSTEYLKETGDLGLLDAAEPFLDGGEGTVLDHLMAVGRIRRREPRAPRPAEVRARRLERHARLHRRQGRRRERLGGDVLCRHARPPRRAPRFREGGREAAPGRASSADRLVGGHRGARLGRRVVHPGLRRGRAEDRLEGERRGPHLHQHPELGRHRRAAGPRRGSSGRWTASRSELDTPYGPKICAPAFREIDPAIGLITRCVPGKKENGAVFCHPAAWAIQAECLLGRGGRAFAYFREAPAGTDRPVERSAPSPMSTRSTSRATSTRRRARPAIPGRPGRPPGCTGWATTTSSASGRPTRGLVIDPVMPRASGRGIPRRAGVPGRAVPRRGREPGRRRAGVASIEVDGRPVEGADRAAAGRLGLPRERHDGRGPMRPEGGRDDAPTSRNPILTRADIPDIPPLLTDVDLGLQSRRGQDGGITFLVLRVQARSRETFMVMAKSADGFRFVVRPGIVELERDRRSARGSTTSTTPGSPGSTEAYYRHVRHGHGQPAASWAWPGPRTSGSSEFLGVTSADDVRNGVLFPEKVGGLYSGSSGPTRPSSRAGRRRAARSGSPDRTTWSSWRRLGPVMGGRFHYWDEYIGSGPPPVKTRQGWLHIYHGVATHFGSANIYQAGRRPARPRATRPRSSAGRAATSSSRGSRTSCAARSRTSSSRRGWSSRRSTPRASPCRRARSRSTTARPTRSVGLAVTTVGELLEAASEPPARLTPSVNMLKKTVHSTAGRDT